jgi:UDP-3-O-[3-hydroxymyristoyl] glucosamine N-acyltransferase
VETGAQALTLREIAVLVGGDLNGPPDLQIKGPGALDTDEPNTILFAISAEYLSMAETSRAAAILLSRDLTSSAKPYIQVDNPKVAFMLLLKNAVRQLPLSPGTHPTAIIDPSATVSSHAQIGAYAVVERGAKVSAGCRIYSFAYIGEDCEIGENCVVYPHAVLYQNVRLGDSTIVHAGAVLGSDGFGFVWDGSFQVKVPQVGSVSIGNDCEIGALSAIDRAMVGLTIIGADTKIDNLVQIGHNAEIGEHTVIAAQAGISGSASIGDRVMIAGQVGVGDHIRIASDVALAARTAAIQDIDSPGEYIGTPAQPLATGKRAMMLLAKLPELFSRVRKLERRADE